METSKWKVVAVIPARLESTRLPRKVLADIVGRSMLQRVYEQVAGTGLFDQVIIATDSEEVMLHCIEHNMRAIVTSNTHASGTDRVAEVASILDADIIVNVQADEPFIENHCLSALVMLMQREGVTIGTLAKPISAQDDLFDYNVVKLTKDINQKVLYFSRQAIPAIREEPYRKWLENHTYFQHLGIYGFRREILMAITNLPQSKLEKAEKLEQLRWIENGYEIYLSEVESDSFGIDTVEDLERARARVLNVKLNSNSEKV